MLESYLTLKAEYEIVPMELKDCAEVALLHGERFPRVWDETEFQGLLSQETTFGFVARQTNAILRKALPGFVLARHVAGEGEILTIAVNAKLGRSGLGWRLMQAALRETRNRGGETMFLEVDGSNQPALGLYRKLGFETVGERKAYYVGENGQRSTALVMRRVLR
ncbi:MULTISPECIES: GNAT family N-acetyltransferase [Rhizobium]|uniref:GNAT family N-acetyltransferase n=1 Tax=Rhizobium tropici TaxID=398 RepID=A0A6P1C436_RHITR|nr:MULTISPECIES: N-acetyltransferase [Rhizobium]AGB69897.1 ribosomal-protein-alanine N-acetyltransferase protein [Rhizobium tropici CIAT 899]MBB4239711.1 ribosomal-protein-alanine N-acetyltransferase [Rhizobium tropici]MBB5590981.1 ribosomal-protein-alanine N-acetyltransferase [Rhizobium tropici]MBB6489810.1 ribosomal-protein-alanine N-acetyltransferase [Rhizobium tropici]NEV09694.1 GNAT family N-acetyltransferase [Rhizobium tropici]